jgi:hypothetical protein
MTLDRDLGERVWVLIQGSDRADLNPLSSRALPAEVARGRDAGYSPTEQESAKRAMSQISIGAAIGSGFGLVGRRPVSVLVWGLPTVALGAVAIWLLAPLYAAMISAAISQAQSGGASPAQGLGMLGPQAVMTSSLVWLLDIVQVFAASVVYCAVWRAVLHPNNPGFAYLRVGVPELMLTLLAFAAAIVAVVAVVVLAIPIGLMVGVAASVGSKGAVAGAAILIPILMLVLVVALVVVGLRFVFVGPMMVDDGKFHFIESWAMTKGHVGALFLIGLGLLAVAIGVEIVFVALMLGLGAAGFFGVVGGVDGLPAFLKLAPTEMLSRLAPLLGAYLVALIPIQGCLLAIFGAPWARAYRDLRPDASETFA